MRRSAPTARREAMAAAAAALALHAWLAWGLNELLMGGSGPAPRAAAHSVLQVVWLPRRAAMPMPRAATTPRARLQVVAVAPQEVRSDDVPAEQAAGPSEPAQALPEELLGQARAWAQQQAPLEFAGADPLANRVAALPGRAANRFRMPPPRSAADIVAMIGQTFGNGEDPCVLNRADLAAYATGRDAKAMALAIDFERRHCRP